MKIPITILFVFVSLLVTSQENKPHIEVTGSAELNLDPNIIVLSVNLREFEENRVKVPLEQIEKDFLDAVSRSGIEKKDIALANLNVNSIMVKRRERETFARKMFEITFSSEKDVLKFLENTKNIRIDNMYISKLDHTEISKYRLEVKVAALKAAERKADALLEAAGVKRGKPILIQELNENNLLPMNRNMVSNSYANFSLNKVVDSDDVQMKKINLRYEMLVQYAIE